MHRFFSEQSKSTCSTVAAKWTHRPSSNRSAEHHRKPEALFMAGPGAFTPEVRFSSGSRDEYAFLFRSECRTKKMLSDDHAPTLPTCTPGRQRQVWDGSSHSKATLVPPQPPWLGSPSSCGVFECSDDEPLWMSVRDGSCFFDQLSLPIPVRSFFAKPYIGVEELCDYEYKGGQLPEQARISSDELVDTPLVGSTVLYPVSTCWPMGAAAGHRPSPNM